jgi:Phage late-transcription coactivator
MPTKNEISEFSEKIIEIASETGMTMMDSILHYCEETGLEVDVASTLISSALKSKIREEAQELNLLKKTARLPV